jgi:cellulose synthase operon protein YhjQ
MTDRNILPDPNETPEDVATLYSWANLHGAKYRDFSASRAQTREKARQRVQEAIETERRRSREEAEAQKAAEVLRVAEAARQVDLEKQSGTMSEMQGSEQGQQTAQWQWQPGLSPMPQPGPASPSSFYTPQPPAPQVPFQPAQQQPAAPQYFAQQPYAPAAPQPMYAQPQYPVAQQMPAYQVPNYVPPAQPAPAASNQPEHYLSTRPSWNNSAEQAVRPAWLAAERSEPAAPSYTHAPEDTLQGSRDRLTSRWFALKGVFPGAQYAQEPAPAPAASAMRAPVLALFSLAGGVGKTSIVANLGRTLASRGERVLLVDTAAFGLLPFYFGARDQRAGVLRTFTAPGSADAPVQTLTLDPEALGPENAPQEMLGYEITRNSQGCARILVDLATASGATTRRVLRMAPTVLVPVVPDMSSVVSVSAIDTFFRNNSAAAGQPIMPVYVLNQFDPSIPLHLDVREVLREQLGERLLPFALRRTPAMSEALAEGMTVVDYSPTSTVAEDFGALAGWVKSLAAPASHSFRGVRWSER